MEIWLQIFFYSLLMHNKHTWFCYTWENAFIIKKQHPLNNTACPISALLTFLLSSQYIKASESYKLSISNVSYWTENTDPTDVNCFTAALFSVDFFYEVVNKLLLMHYYKLVCSTWLYSIFNLKSSLSGEPFTLY